MGDNEVKPTWKLAWGLWWRIVLISIGVQAVVMGILFLVGASFIPWSIFSGLGS